MIGLRKRDKHVTENPDVVPIMRGYVSTANTAHAIAGSEFRQTEIEAENQVR